MLVMGVEMMLPTKYIFLNCVKFTEDGLFLSTVLGKLNSDNIIGVMLKAKKMLSLYK